MSELLEELKASRGSSAELKLKLITLRNELPDDYILVFEGDDDRAIYFSWMRYLDANFQYEPFTCDGKKSVLKLKGAVDRDAGGLGRKVLFFVDRDFDDLSSIEVDDSIYVTDGYSVENDLVNADVLDEVLKIEFHCHQAPASRRLVLAAFEDAYAAFIEASSAVNFELFVARRYRIELEDDLPKSVHRFVDVGLHAVTALPIHPSEIVRPIRPIEDSEREASRAQFEGFDRRMRFRGKFALSFFMKWLEKLAEERRAQRNGLFEGLPANVRVAHGRLSLATLASRSSPPESLFAFMDAARQADYGQAA